MKGEKSGKNERSQREAERENVSLSHANGFSSCMQRFRKLSAIVPQRLRKCFANSNHKEGKKVDFSSSLGNRLDIAGI